MPDNDIKKTIYNIQKNNGEESAINCIKGIMISEVKRLTTENNTKDIEIQRK